MAVVHDSDAGLWGIGPESLGGRALVSAEAPELVLRDLDGNEFRLSSLRGQKVRARRLGALLRLRLRPARVAGPAQRASPRGSRSSRSRSSSAAPRRPGRTSRRRIRSTRRCSIPTHRMDTLFGVVNIPNVVWIDEARHRSCGRPSRAGPAGVDEHAARACSTLDRRSWAASTTAPQVAREGKPRRSPASPRAGPRQPTRTRSATGSANGSAEPLRDDPGRGRRAFAGPRPGDVRRGRPLRAGQPPLAGRAARRGDRALQREPSAAARNWTYKRQAWSLVGNERVGGGVRPVDAGPAPRARKPTGRSTRTSAPTSPSSTRASTTRRLSSTRLPGVQCRVR